MNVLSPSVWCRYAANNEVSEPRDDVEKASGNVVSKVEPNTASAKDRASTGDPASGRGLIRGRLSSKLGVVQQGHDT